MKNIFESGHFSSYRINDSQIDRSTTETRVYAADTSRRYRTTVFLSHKHADLEDLKGLIGFLRLEYNVDVYIDSRDSAMPKETSAQTAVRIKKIIDKCDRFILLATDGAIESKWCNWELGYGDARKYKDKIALFPMKPSGTYDYKYKGNEYMQMYPSIEYYGRGDEYSNGNPIEPGYYVGYFNSEGGRTITRLEEWLR